MAKGNGDIKKLRSQILGLAIDLLKADFPFVPPGGIPPSDLGTFVTGLAAKMEAYVVGGEEEENEG